MQSLYSGVPEGHNGVSCLKSRRSLPQSPVVPFADSANGPPPTATPVLMRNVAHPDLLVTMFIAMSTAFAPLAISSDTVALPLERQMSEVITPFLATYCHDCHGAEVQEAKLDLSPYTSLAAFEQHHQTWEEVLHRLEAHEMPPEDADQPPDALREQVVSWIRDVRHDAAMRSAGDPGPVVTRRLSNAEYNYTIRDLTGWDLRPTSDFPVDPANEAGFDTSGESLAMSPALMQKYLGAARQISEHIVLKPHGFAFAPHPVVTETDRDKYCVKRIVEFYQRQPTDYADYFLAAWTFKHREALGQPRATLADVAAEQNISVKYLKLLWSALEATPEQWGPLSNVQQSWRALPADTLQISDVRRQCEALRDSVVSLRRQLEPSVKNLELEGSHRGSQPFVLWKNHQYAAHRRSFVPETIASIVADSPQAQAFPELVAPQDPDDLDAFHAALQRFCETFPDAFYISERGRDYVGKAKDQQEKGRLLSAGFHSMMGYYRDDAPLYEMILDPSAQQQLDRLWQELDFVTAAPLRQYTGFIWFDRTDSRFMRDEEFDFARAEDKQVTSEALIMRLSEVYLDKARRNGGSDEVLQSIADYFRDINQQIRWVEQARIAAEPSHLETLLAFASRAYRRPLSASEQNEWLEFYRSLREVDGLDHEEAIQDCVVSILMSPWFCYRVDLIPTADEQMPLSDIELASRLSYFLWSSMPDEELMRIAEAGQLRDPAVLVAQASRMLSDRRAEALATEFGGNWLDFRRFEQHNSVDRERFPAFTDSLRQAMFEEPIRFFVDLLRHDGSVLQFIDAPHTFVNAELAAHYGIDSVDFTTGRWQKVEDANQYHRGGLLPMAIFQTQNAPGLRTSPVKRGYWVVRRLLGERIPPPPPDVPELPEDEQDLGNQSLADMLAKHREHQSCAACHDRFDSIGLVFENYGPVGEWRTTDLGGRDVDSQAVFPGGMQGAGMRDLLIYLKTHRQEEFVDNLCRKLLSYALGRNLLLSDGPLVEAMRMRLEADDYRFSGLVATIITSSQFLEKRGRDGFVKDARHE